MTRMVVVDLCFFFPIVIPFGGFSGPINATVYSAGNYTVSREVFTNVVHDQTLTEDGGIDGSDNTNDNMTIIHRVVSKIKHKHRRIYTYMYID